MTVVVETHTFKFDDETWPLTQARLSWGFVFVGHLLMLAGSVYGLRATLHAAGISLNAGADVLVGHLFGSTWFVLAGFLVTYPLGHVWRMQTFKKAWRWSHIQAKKYVEGHGLMACCLAVVPVWAGWLAYKAAEPQAYAAAVVAAMLGIVALLVNLPRRQVRAAADGVSSAAS